MLGYFSIFQDTDKRVSWIKEKTNIVEHFKEMQHLKRKHHTPMLKKKRDWKQICELSPECIRIGNIRWVLPFNFLFYILIVWKVSERGIKASRISQPED